MSAPLFGTSHDPFILLTLPVLTSRKPQLPDEQTPHTGGLRSGLPRADEGSLAHMARSREVT